MSNLIKEHIKNSNIVLSDIADASNLIMNIRFDFINKDSIYEIKNTIKLNLMNLNLNPEITDRLMLSIIEILSNLMQHPDIKPTKTHILLFMSHEQIILDILDNGSEFYNYKEQMQNSINNLENINLSETGRGLGLISKNHPINEYIRKDISPDNLNHFRLIDNLQINSNDMLNIEFIDEEKLPIIFVIDDDNVIRMIISRILKEHYKIYCFATGKEAIEKFPFIKPDIIISDILMPEMDGIELRKEILKIKDGAKTPFIFLSGYKNEAEKPYINNLGIDGFLHKPVKKEILLPTMNRLLSRSKQLQANIQNDFAQSITSALNVELPDKVHNWKISLKQHVAEAGGGDFVMYKKEDDGMSIILVDVMGHGLEAKFFAYAYAGYLRSIYKILNDHQNPDIFLKKLSDFLYKDPFLDNSIITCACLWLSNSGELRVSSAGHPAPLLISNNSIEKIDISGPLPGLLENNFYSVYKGKLKAEEKLLLYTDGMPENGLNLYPDLILEDLNEFIEYKIWKKSLNRQESHGTDKKDDMTLISITFDGE